MHDMPCTPPAKGGSHQGQRTPKAQDAQAASGGGGKHVGKPVGARKGGP